MILFLSLFFIFGIIILLVENIKISKNTSFDYSKDDSIFYSATNRHTIKNNSEKSIDSNQELFNFSGNKNKNSSFKKSDKKLAIINLNYATIDELKKYPGIGDVTARKIFEYRKKVGKLKTVSELLINNILSRNKFEQIKEFIIVD